MNFKRMTGKMSYIWPVVLIEVAAVTFLFTQIHSLFALANNDELTELTTTPIANSIPLEEKKIHADSLTPTPLGSNDGSDIILLADIPEIIPTPGSAEEDGKKATKKDYYHLFYAFHDNMIDVEELMSIYNKGQTEIDILNNDKNATIAALTNLLVTQMDMNPTIAAGILGNVCSEGDFGEQQKTHAVASSLSEYRQWLERDDSKGYGVAQWTSQKRQDKLEARLGEVYDTLIHLGYAEEDLEQGKMFTVLVVLAEGTFLYDEVQAYDLFKDYNTTYSIEHACGIIGKCYEAYSNSGEQWERQENGYVLVGDENCSGYNRLQNSYRIYNDILDLD